jgi:transcriptional regulator with XRE-family HTH domain
MISDGKNHDDFEKEGAAMFDMTRIGANISKFRKAVNMTQTELADKLNISYQAVSNWERGISMPDISKLSELSGIFGVSIDDLLENKRAAQLVAGVNSNTTIPDIGPDELLEIAPIMKPEQVDKAVEDSEMLDTGKLAAVAPFLSQQFLDNMAEKIFNKTGDLGSLCPIAPFISTGMIDKLTAGLSANGADIDKITCMLPFISESVINDFAEKRYKETGSLRSLCKAAPFLGQNIIDKSAADAVAKNYDLSSIACIAPFISRDVINQLAATALAEKGLDALSPIMPFIDAKIIEDYITEKIK